MARFRKLTTTWSLEAQQRFLFRFTELVENGFSIWEGLNVMKVLFPPDKIQLMIDSCQNGYSFSKTLQDSAFEERIIYIISCSEESGSLIQGLQKARDYSGHRLQNKKELQKKLRYPSFLFFIMLIILTAVYLFFLPQIKSFYETFNIEGNQVAFTGIITLIGTVLSFLLLFSLLTLLILNYKHIPFQLKVKNYLFSWLGVRYFAQRLFSYYFSTQWLMLDQCGMPLKDSLATIKSFEKVPIIRLIIDELERKLDNGEPLDKVISSSSYFSPYFQLIIVHGLKLGSVRRELEHFTTNELTQLNQLLTTFFKIFQGCFLVLIGIIIILLYLSILQPVFEMVQLL